MSHTKYLGELHIIPHNNGQDTPTEKLVLPIQAFEVDGGVNRMISLASTDDISVSSEFEQARANKNLVFYIAPTPDFRGVKLMQMGAGPGIVFFDMNFTIDIYSGHTKTQSLWIGTDEAWISPTPSPQGGTPPSLKAKIHFHEVHLLHGKYDPRRKKIVNTEM
jgi:hypothetical protein